VEEAEIQIHRQDAKMAEDRADYWINVLSLVLEKTGDVELPAESLEYHRKPTGAVSRTTIGDTTILRAFKILRDGESFENRNRRTGRWHKPQISNIK